MALCRFSKRPCLLTSLPDELTVNIIARVPRSNYPTISLVCRRFRSIVASPELYNRRSLLRCTEHCLYVLLYSPQTRDYRWYILRRNALVHLPWLPPVSLQGSVVAVGSKIYVFSGVSDTASALIIDCTSHMVQPISSIPKPMGYTIASFIDGKIYVMGRCVSMEDEDTKRVMVLDIETQMWESKITKPGIEIGQLMSCCVVVDGKIYMRDMKDSFFYEPRDGKWEIDEILNSERWESACVVDGILYYYDYWKNRLIVYDAKIKCWGVVKGVGRLLPEPRNRALWSYTVSCGEKLAVFLSKQKDGMDETEIWCAEIALERRRQGEEIWGKVEWCNVVIDGDFLYMRCVDVMV